MEKDIKISVNKNLSEIKKTKGILLQERREISNVISNIVESRKIKNQRDAKIIYNDLRNTVSDLIEEGYHVELIEEQILSSLGGGWWTRIKTEAIKSFLSWAFGDKIKRDSWLGTIVANSLARVKLSDFPKLFTDCDFVTKVVGDGIVAGVIDKVQQSTGFDGWAFDSIRNALLKTFDGTDFKQAIDESVGDFVCGWFGKKKSSVDKVKNKIKSAEDKSTSNLMDKFVKTTTM